MRNSSGIDGARRWLHAAFAAVLLACVVACETTSTPPPPKPTWGVQLVPANGSAITGYASFQQVDDGVIIALQLWAGTSGPWRVVIHTNAVCTSPNGFGAGPPAIFPGSADPVSRLIVTNEAGIGNLTIKIPGLTIEGPNGILGKSLVIHSGPSGSLEATPGVPNNRVACGVIEKIKLLF